MRDVLTEDGAIFLTVRDGTGKLENRSLQIIDGETYDRNFIAHTLPELTESAAPSSPSLMNSAPRTADGGITCSSVQSYKQEGLFY